jgi:hypothetical protein
MVLLKSCEDVKGDKVIIASYELEAPKDKNRRFD